MRIQAAGRVGRAFDLLAADIRFAVQDLALKVGQRDHVVVGDADGPDARGGQILDQRRAEAASADDEDPSALELELAGSADIAQDDMPGVSFDFVWFERHLRLLSPCDRPIQRCLQPVVAPEQFAVHCNEGGRPNMPRRIASSTLALSADLTGSEAARPIKSAERAAALKKLCDPVGIVDRHPPAKFRLVDSLAEAFAGGAVERRRDPGR